MTQLNIDTPRALQTALADLPTSCAKSREAAANRQAILTKPAGSLGRLEDVAIWMAGWQETENPVTEKPACLVFAGNHGVTAQGVSAYPAEVTAQMVMNFEAGGAAINQLTRLAGVSLDVIALDLDQPTADFTKGPAMSEEECCAALQIGANAVPHDIDFLLLGEMGIGNTTSAAALCLATFGGSAANWVGPGTGVDAEGLRLKQRVVKNAVSLHTKEGTSAFDRLRTLGGRELAAIAGATLEARRRRIPVMLDGFISTAAAAVLTLDNTAALDHALISHRSAEPGHIRLAEKLDKTPLLDFGMRLGEASGAALAFLIVKAALATHNDMATFGEAGVSTNAEVSTNE